MKLSVLIFVLALLIAAPAMFEPPTGVSDGLVFAEKDDNKGEQPVIIIKGKGGKVTKVKKPKPKDKK